MNVSSPDRPAPDRYAHPCAWDVALPELTVPGLLERAAGEAPGAPAIDFMGRTYSYAQVFDEARRVAAGLAARGIGKGDRVGLFLPNVPIYLSAYYGAMMAGAVVVNFSPLYTAEELSAQVADSGARILVTVDVASLLPTALKVLESSALETLVVGSLGAMLPWTKRVALKVLGRKALAKVPHRSDVTHWPDFLGEPGASLPPVARDDLALLQYTGGTTGRPKGAMLTHANLATNALQIEAIDPAGGRTRRDPGRAAPVPRLREYLRPQPHRRQQGLHRDAAAVRSEAGAEDARAGEGDLLPRRADDVPGAA